MGPIKIMVLTMMNIFVSFLYSFLMMMMMIDDDDGDRVASPERCFNLG